ncbi:hypothetical protein [Dyella silvatica]|uniref:hypothetical protein n=1 Tax=Dyella silvatica TaxID=2992128 RepID=UPI00224EFAC3|nr:hypothetical protein [Dyella silvatica]
MGEDEVSPDQEAFGTGLRLVMGIVMAVTFTVVIMQPFIRMPEGIRLVAVLLIFACSSSWVVVGYLRRPGGVEKRGKLLTALAVVTFLLLIFLATLAAALVSVALFSFLP